MSTMSSAGATNSNDDSGYKFAPSDIGTLQADFYQLSDEDKQFFRENVRFRNDEELKEHAFEIRRRAYAVSSTPCWHVTVAGV